MPNVFQTFAGTIKNVVSHSQIQNIPEKLKVKINTSIAFNLVITPKVTKNTALF